MKNADELNTRELARLIIDFIHRIAIHHGMWFSEVQHQLGQEKAQKIINEVYLQSYEVQIKRLSKILNFTLDDNNIPTSFLNSSREDLIKLKDNLATNWLANDGIWFQAVENTNGMFDAKRCNDSCWAQFSPFEALSIKKLLNLKENSGVDGLKNALNFRLYASINKQHISEENEHSFVFSMSDCRVQSARKRKGLEDYPCKSAGMVEYTTFASAIDQRIKTECIGCPPDKHPEEWYCSWRFSI
ncbi:MAG: cytosolic protein [Oligoflexia bacterium]|nr:cytosolic protein [Oligoflexia bacterium]